MSAAYRRKAIGEAVRRFTVEPHDGKHRVRDGETGLPLPDQFDDAALAEARRIDLIAEQIERVIDEEMAGR